MYPKEKTIWIEIPRKYKYICRQFHGTYMICVTKPFIQDSGMFFDEDKDNPVEPIQHWGTKDHNYIEIDFEERVEDWKKSLRRI